MGDWAIINQLTGNPEQIISVNNKEDFEEAGWYKGTGRVAASLPVDYSYEDILNKSYYDIDTQEFKSRIASPGEFWYWSTDKRWEVESDRVMATLRNLRNNLLIASDWTQVADVPFTDEKKAEWVTYRQALRDITKDVSSDLDTLVGFPWPTPPS
jgi:hypothetical protein